MKGDFIGFRISTENNENPFVVKLFYLHLTNVNKIYCYFEAGYGIERKEAEGGTGREPIFYALFSTENLVIFVS